MAAVRHLGFLKVRNFYFRSGSEAQCASSCQISRRSVKPFQRYGRFSAILDFFHACWDHTRRVGLFGGLCDYKKPQHVFFLTRSPRPPTSSQHHMDLRVWAYPRPGYISQVSSKSVQGFRRPRGSKFGLFHYFGYSLLQQLVLPYKPRLVRYVQAVIVCQP